MKDYKELLSEITDKDDQKTLFRDNWAVDSYSFSDKELVVNFLKKETNEKQNKKFKTKNKDKKIVFDKEKRNIKDIKGTEVIKDNSINDKEVDKNKEKKVKKDKKTS